VLCAFLLGAGSALAADALVQVGLPDRPWKLLVELPGFEMSPVQHLKGGARVSGTSERTGLVVSMTLAASPGDPSPRSCRDHDWAGRQLAQPLREDTRLSQQGDRARVEFIVPESAGETVREKHILLYLQRDGVCAIVHLYKLRYQPGDAALLETVLTSVRLAG
jgi:hypothetical protein